MTPTRQKNLYRAKSIKELRDHNQAWSENEETLEDEENEDGTVTMPDSFSSIFDDQFDTLE